MSLILKQNIEKNGWNADYREQRIQPGYWYWGKATTIDETTLLLMQGPVSCKDYVVDTYFKECSQFEAQNWTKKEKQENCIYVNFPNAVVQQKCLDNITNFLNPWFAENGISPVIIRPITTHPFRPGGSYRLFGIQGDAKWTSNAFAWSLYLSIIRLCGYKKDMKTIDFTYDEDQCNEHHYYYQSTQKKLLLAVFQNPFPYLAPLPKPYKNTGYTSATKPAHGQTGPFFYAQSIHAAKESKYDYTAYINNSYFGNMFYEQTYGEPYKYVR